MIRSLWILLAVSLFACAGGASAQRGQDFSATIDVASRNMHPPRYPRSAFESGAQGTTVLVIDIDKHGAPVEVSVETSAGHADLDDAAIAAARAWRFHPGMRKGMPIGGRVRVPVTFAF